jgi:hypothetical protein
VFTYEPHAALATIGYDPSRVGDPPGWLELNGFAPAGDALVSLTSSDPAAFARATVTVPAGSRTGNFTLTFLPIPRTENVTLTARYEGSAASTSIGVRAWPPLSLDLGASELGRGDSTTAKVTLNTPAPATGASVALKSSDPSAVPVPPSVTVPADAFTGTFTATGNYSGSPKTVTITATYNGASASASLTVPARTLPPTPECKPKSCPSGTFWNPDDCQCERGRPQ